VLKTILRKLLVALTVSLAATDLVLAIDVRDFLPQNADFATVTEGTVINGLRTDIYKFGTQSSLADVVEAANKQAGGRIQDKTIGKFRTLSFMEDRRFYTLQLRPRLSVGVDGTIAVANLAERVAQPALPDGLALPVGARVIYWSQSRDDGREATMFVCATRTAASVAAQQFATVLQKRGYQNDDHLTAQKANTQVLMYSKGAKQLVSTFRKHEGGLTMVVLNLTVDKRSER